ncbi:MAG: methyltransferase [Bacteroidales bacterium]|nr:methyltransferase [Bacteroidales bacterium]
MRFRQFSVDDARCAMKVGTDGILLGAWVSCEGTGRLLDIGTGSGLIALMAAQRCAARGDRRFHISAIEIDAEAAAQAADNFAASPWAEQLSALPLTLDGFVAEGHDGEFDVIVSNPPYYITGKSIIPSGAQRTAARRDSELTLDDILQAAARLLAPQGKLSLILPTAREADLQSAMDKAGMAFTRRCLVRTTERKAPSRLLAEIGRTPCCQPSETSLTIGSEDFRKLTGDYYL